jgi:predicted metal-dependent RNase
MEMNDICPCVNLECPNHGICEKCTSRHLKLGSLNYCAFYTVLPEFQESIAASPESATAKKMALMVENRLATYGKLMEKHGLSREGQEKLLKEVANFSDY